MKSGSEGTVRCCANKIVWIQKQKQEIQYGHPNGRRQKRNQWGELWGRDEGISGEGKRRQRKLSEEQRGRLAVRGLSRMFQNPQLVPDWRVENETKN